MTGTRIAMIGGGAAVVSLLDNLLERAEILGPDIELCVYEPSNLACGEAFGFDLDCALLNLPNDSISIRLKDPHHFLRWLEVNRDYARNTETVAPSEAFSPRRVFGTYLKEHYRHCREHATRFGWKITRYPETVTGLSDCSATDSILVRSTKAVRSYTHVVLAIGPGSAADPYRLKGASGFYSTPYPLIDTLPMITDPHAHVAIIGTGLTAVDTAIGLLNLGHQGPITMASRRGILPEVRAPKRNQELARIASENLGDYAHEGQRLELNDVWKMVQDELNTQGFDPAIETSWFRPNVSPIDYLRHQLENPNGNAFQSILMRIPPDLGNVIRSSMSDLAIRHMSTVYTPRLKSLQCPMPRTTAQMLLKAMDAKQLRIVRGLSDINFEAGHFSISAESVVHKAEIVFDATHTSPARTSGRSRRLIASLRAIGYATWDVHNGLRTELKSGRIMLPCGELHSKIFAIGEITAGDIYYASSLPRVNRGAAAVASALAESSQRDLSHF
ncbi:FAD/NAD(P)-binding protein [Streptomyces sp. NPDC004230]